ncbi:sodium channel and clathrin linker 1-like [Xenia sp. Carnegie-2017]|uniref:sodium channel and clathrin linker 1-like n=1 Tax=Xenia sp. Carnegie-2017 TaxID=2897299 RepID=UPI001F045FB5|nr:sodium channel and clathrin linker 1-like [Xenia sp. Carnegie-2017]
MDGENKDSNADYVEFLQNQVSRLNSVLSAYQRKYLPICEEDIKLEYPIQPWLCDSSIISPLLAEYDNTIRTFKNELNEYKKEQSSLKERIAEVVRENGKMLQERRVTLEREMDKAPSTLIMQSEKSVIDNNIVENVQNQLEIAIKERDYNCEMLKKTSQELEELHLVHKKVAESLAAKVNEANVVRNDLIKARRFAEQLQATNRKIKGENDQFVVINESQNRKIEKLSEDVRRYKAELKCLTSTNDEFKRRLEVLRAQSKLRERDKALLSSKEQDVESRFEEYRTKIIEIESRLAGSLAMYNRVQNKNAELEEQLDLLTKKNFEQERCAYEAEKNARESMQLVESAMIERDQVLVREKQNSEELDRLQEVIKKLLFDAGIKTKNEVSKVKDHYNENIKKLMEELQHVEMEGANKQAQLERALREKGAIEKELEKIYQEGPTEIARAGMTFEQLQKKIIFAERTKEEALQTKESLTSLLHKLEKKHDQQKTQLLQENQELKKRIKHLTFESEDIAGNRIILMDEIDNLKRELVVSQSVQEQLKQKCATEVASLEQRHKVKERQFDEKLRNVEEMNTQSVNELREMLSAQQKMGYKWKEESQVLSKKFEDTVSSLRNEITKQNKRNDVVTHELLEAKRHSKQIEDDLLSTQVQLQKAQSIAVDAESRAEAASKQVETLLNRERQLLDDRKILHKELETSRVQRKHNGSFFTRHALKDSYNNDSMNSMEGLQKSLRHSKYSERIA